MMGAIVTDSAASLFRFGLVMQSGTFWETFWPIDGGVCNVQDIVRRDTNGWRPPMMRAG